MTPLPGSDRWDPPLRPGESGADRLAQQYVDAWCANPPEPEPVPWAAALEPGTTDRAVELLRELVAGADDYRCWWIPEEIDEPARALLAEIDQEI